MFFLREGFPFPPDLGEQIHESLWQGRNARPLAQRGVALRKLWERLAKRRGQVAEGEMHYSFRPEEADAYAAYYLPANCLKPALVLEESFLLGQDPVPGGEAVWLDLGTGPGTAFWGAAWWCARRGKKLRFTGWDQSNLFADIARGLAANSPFQAEVNFQAGAGDPLQLVRKLAPTHVSFVNSLAEIYPDPNRRLEEISKILRALKELERKDGKKRQLLLLEPGSRESSRELAELKDKLQENKTGFIYLPCLDTRPCGALRDERDWCHEEAACEFPDWLNELGAEAGLRKEALLFSYALMGTTPSSQGISSGRIVSQRLERKGQVECRLCLPEGKKLVRVQRSKATPDNEAFLACVRGDLWSQSEIGEKGDLSHFTPLPPSSISPLLAPKPLEWLLLAPGKSS